MTEVILPCGRVFHLDEADLPILNGMNWHADKRGKTFYVRGRKSGVSKGGVYLHNLLMGGRTDHRDGDGLNNRKNNLRRCTQDQNTLNRGPSRGKRFKGVYPRGRLFYAQLYRHGVAYHSYGHATAEAAARAYDALALKHHGEFARLNFPSEPCA